MKSKEVLEELEVWLLTHPDTTLYAGMLKEHFLKHIEKDLEVKDILIKYIKKILTDPDNWWDDNFGALKNKLYIDGAVQYESDEDKIIIQQFIKDILQGRI